MSSCGGCGGAACHREDEIPKESTKVKVNLSIAEQAMDGDHALCSKCGEDEQTCNGLCTSCFRAHLFGKFKLAVTTNAMISPTDNVLVAFSGGPASRVALQFVYEMQSKALQTWDLSKSQALPVFGMGVAFIDESSLSLSPSHEIDSVIEQIRSIVSDLSPPRKELHIIPIESICSLGHKDGVRRLNELLGTITDATGKEDFVRYLRMLSFQKIALENKYNKLVLGSCASAIARHVISATAKGQGYSLPADVQYVDSRWEVPVVLPLRDCLEQDLRMLCHLNCLKTQQLLNTPSTGINGLVSSFISRLLDENPSRERTIVRTAEKLRPFSFNKFAENGYQEFVPSRLRPKFQNAKNDETTPPVVLCAICWSPLSESELQASKDFHGKANLKIELFVAHCCQSCCFQILPKEAVSLEHFYAALPQSITEKIADSINIQCSLREQIKDFLLSDDGDDDDGT